MGEKVVVTAKKPKTKERDSASIRRKKKLLQCTSSPIDHILFLQREMGNQAVQKLCKSRWHQLVSDTDCAIAPRLKTKDISAGNSVASERRALPLQQVALREQSPIVRRDDDNDGEEVRTGIPNYVFMDAPVALVPGQSRSTPLVGPERLWPLPNSTPCSCANDYFYQFWEPNIQYQREENGTQLWWEDYQRPDGSWYHRYTRFTPSDGVCHIGGYPLSRPTSMEQETEQPSASEEIPENPSQLDLTADPETMYGEEIASRANVEIMGWEGYTILYADGTIELFAEGSEAPYTFRPQPEGFNAYEFYNQEGRKVENLIIAADPIELFGLTPAPEPEE